MDSSTSTGQAAGQDQDAATPIAAQAAAATGAGTTSQPPTSPAAPVDGTSTPAPASPADASSPAPTDDAAQDGPEPGDTQGSSDIEVGSLVSWEVSEDGSDAVSILYGLVVENGVELGRDNATGSDLGTGTRVAQLHDLRVLEPSQLTAL